MQRPTTARVSWSRSDSDESDGRQNICADGFDAGGADGMGSGGNMIAGAAVGPAGSVEIQLEPEQLNMLYRRSRRRLRDIQATCQAFLKLDRVRGTLHVSGSQAAIEAVQNQLDQLGGPVMQLPAAVWAELMRTRTLKVGKQATIMRLQDASGCRIHIERSRQEVRVFGPKERVAVAERQIEEFAETCGEEAVPTSDPTVCSAGVLQAIAHAFGITLRVEDKQVLVLGLKEAVSRAVGELRKYLSDPEHYQTDSLPQAPPCEEPSEQDTCGVVAAVPQQQQPAAAVKTPAAARPKRGTAGGAPAAGRQSQDAAAPAPKGSCTCCPTCGASRFCYGCGVPVWQWNPLSPPVMMQPWMADGYAPQLGMPFCYDTMGQSKDAEADAQKWARQPPPYMYPMDPKAGGEAPAGGCMGPMQPAPGHDGCKGHVGQASGSAACAPVVGQAGQVPMMQAYMLPRGMIPNWCGN